MGIFCAAFSIYFSYLVTNMQQIKKKKKPVLSNCLRVTAVNINAQKVNGVTGPPPIFHSHSVTLFFTPV